MITLQKIKTAWLKARIAYHRRQANSYSRPVIRSFKRDNYEIWLHNEAMRHRMKAHALERELMIATG